MTDNPHPAESPGTQGEPKEERVVIRDKRKVDFTAGVAKPAGQRSKQGSENLADGADAPAAGAGDGAADSAAPAAPVTSGDAQDDGGETGSASAGAQRPESNGAESGGPKSDGSESNGTESNGSGEVIEGIVLDATVVDDESVVDGVVESGPTADGKQADSKQADSKQAGAAKQPAEDRATELAELRTRLDERTADLLRIPAEYANYRKRVDRDRALAAEQATGVVLVALLPVLDDLDRARDHDDLVGPFAAVAEQLTAALTKFGLVGFGTKGVPFDPKLHEAVAHLTSADVTEPTCVDVLRRGYLLGERLLRPAMVAVADPD